MFDQKTIEQLKFYVYLLVNPETDEPFYVGKGNGNRVFEHVKCALTEDVINNKYEEIRKIIAERQEVKHLIVRHGLTEKGAFEIESALIDTFKFIPKFENFAKGNIQGGVKSIEKGLMTTDEIKRLYNAEILEKIDSNCLIININKTYKRGSSEDSIYHATKEIWNMNKNRLHKIEFVLSEYRGLIVEVFKVHEWYPKERGYNKGAKKYGETYIGYGFNGEVASSIERDRYINKTIAPFKKRGCAGVLIYPETLKKLTNQ